MIYEGCKQMKKSVSEFAVVTDKDNVVKKIGKSSVLHPKTSFCGKKTKWFDDSKLLKKK